MNEELIYAGQDHVADFLEHYGVGHLDGGHSGRYAWGSGKNTTGAKEGNKSRSRRQLIKETKERQGYGNAIRAMRTYMENAGEGNHAYGLSHYFHGGEFTNSFQGKIDRNPELKKSIEDLREFINNGNLSKYEDVDVLKALIDDAQNSYFAPRILKDRYERNQEKLARQEEKAQQKAEKQEAKAQAKKNRPQEKQAREEAKEQKKIELDEKKKAKMKQQLEDKKFKLLRMNDIKGILSNQELFTDQEIQNALNRSNNLKNLAGNLPKTPSAMDRLENLSDGLNKTAQLIINGKKLYDAVTGGSNNQPQQKQKNQPQQQQSQKQNNQPQQKQQQQQQQAPKQNSQPQQQAPKQQTQPAPQITPPPPTYLERLSNMGTVFNEPDRHLFTPTGQRTLSMSPAEAAQARYQRSAGVNTAGMSPAQRAQEEYYRRMGW